MTRRQIADEVKSGDIVADADGNEFVVIKRERYAKASAAEIKTQFQTMRRLATAFKLITAVFVLGLAGQLGFILTGSSGPTGLPGGFALIVYAFSAYTVSVILEFLANLGERLERINQYLAKKENRSAINELLKD